MTTIIARKKELVADRRKIIEGNKVGMIGVRDEAKIDKLPFCLYGISGTEFTYPREGTLTKADIFAELAVVMGLSYIAEGDAEVDAHFLQMLDVKNHHLQAFKQQLIFLRNILGGQLARDLESVDQHVIAMGHFNTIHCSHGNFLNINNNDTVVLGTGLKMASILLDHDYSYDRLYKAMRASGIPTGETYDILTVEKDLPRLFPPIVHGEFLWMMIQMFYRTEKHEFKEGITKDLVSVQGRGSLSEIVATFLSFGKIKEGKWGDKMVFNSIRPPVFDWDRKARTERRKLYEIACQLVRVDPVQDNPEEVVV